MQKGFTLIELLLVIGILVILITATIIAINPLRQFALANNASRYSGVTTIMDAIYQNVVDNRGKFSCEDSIGDVPGTPTPIKVGAYPANYDLCGCIVPTYVSTLPFDPQDGNYTDCTAYDTAYTIEKSGGRYKVCAPSTQEPETSDICVTR